VNEEGTEAAAATGVIGGRVSHPSSVRTTRSSSSSSRRTPARSSSQEGSSIPKAR